MGSEMCIRDRSCSGRTHAATLALSLDRSCCIYGALFDEACIESNVIFWCSQCGAQLSQSRAGGGALVRSGLQRLESRRKGSS